MLQSNAGGIPQEAVGAGERRQRQRDRCLWVGRRPMELFQGLAGLAGLGSRGVVGVGGRRRLRACVGDAVEFALAAPAPHREIEGAIFADRDVGQRQRRARNEFFFHSLIA